MIEKRFRLELTFKTDIETDEVGNDDYGDELYIKQFINEFVNHPDAILSFSKQCLLYMVIEDDDKKTIGKLLNATEDDRHFYDVASHCPANVKNFIHDLFSTTPTKKIDECKREKLINDIEERLGNLSVINARFALLNPENNPTTETFPL